ncbi:hypothetical protein BC938DRAFT_473210 [Jimgerdemannia flammicorona]|uniref:Uncharacterized protein n=1 Tax=Jimgerdemannia flammicorona TaxID=994334 RepID=A0A433Q4F6_9FUNG|nr:hypothetical protein BC938DRAFT_473210 [Jimgerdemannia flammicorona]
MANTHNSSSLSPKTIVATPVLLPWLSSIPAIILLGFPGTEGGNALASLLFDDDTARTAAADNIAERVTLGALSGTYTSFLITGLVNTLLIKIVMPIPQPVQEREGEPYKPPSLSTSRNPAILVTHL